MIPVIVRDVNWSSAPFAKLQALPKDRKAVMKWPKRDTTWRNVSEGIENIARQIRGHRVGAPRAGPLHYASAPIHYGCPMTNDPRTNPPRTLTLPDDLRQSIARALAAVPPARWVREAQLLSERYRAARPANQLPLATGEPQALGYAALIMPATYAQLRGALAATAARIPGWAPATLLDLGSGPGTALWAATAQWPVAARAGGLGARAGPDRAGPEPGACSQAHAVRSCQMGALGLARA